MIAIIYSERALPFWIDKYLMIDIIVTVCLGYRLRPLRSLRFPRGCGIVKTVAWGGTRLFSLAIWAQGWRRTALDFWEMGDRIWTVEVASLVEFLRLRFSGDLFRKRLWFQKQACRFVHGGSTS